MRGEQKPIELILARNFTSSLTTPAFLVDEDGTLVFYNEAAGSLLGKRFEEAGAMSSGEWSEEWGPFDEAGKPIPFDELPLTLALRGGRPAHSKFRIRSVDGNEHAIQVSALPIVTTDGSRGALAFFWRIEDGAAPS